MTEIVEQEYVIVGGASLYPRMNVVVVPMADIREVIS